VPQQARSRRTVERALEAAAECFEKKGYDETTTAMIAERAGIGVGTLYGYFSDKREVLLELLVSVVEPEFDPIIERLDPLAWQRSDPREWSRSLIDMVFHSQHLRPGLQRIMWERYFKDPLFRDPFDAVRSKMRLAILGFIDGVEARGMLRDVDREAAAEAILNAVQWNATQTFLHGDAQALDSMAATVADMVIRLLFADAD
jgi:TetR/AcrR family transcriptional repressor of mexJK operon